MKSFYLARLRRQEQICVFPFLTKIQNGRHMWEEENFLKIAKSTLLRYPVGQKFRRNCSISHGYGDRSKFVFFHFWQKFENTKWPPFLGRGKFYENCQEYISLIPCGAKHFDEIALSRTVKEIEANLCFSMFWQKFEENTKWPPFLGSGKCFENCQEYISQISCESKIVTKSLYLARLRRQKQICVLPFLAKIRKFKMAATFWERKLFLKIAKSTLLRYPVGRKFR